MILGVFMGDFDISIIRLINNDILTIEESIDSIISQNRDFKENIQLILLDLGSSDGSYEVAKEYEEKYPNNIKLMQYRDESWAYGVHFNRALKEAEGEFIHFFDPRSELSQNAYSEAKKYIKKYSSEVDIVYIPVYYFDKKAKVLRPKVDYVKSDIVDVKEHIDHSIIYLGAAFIKKDAIGDLQFDEVLIDCEIDLFFTEILMKKEKYALVQNAKFIRNKKKLPNKYKTPKYVKNKFNLFFNHFIDKFNGDVPRYIQYLLVSELNPIVRIDDLNEFYDPKEKEIEDINEYYGFDEGIDYVPEDYNPKEEVDNFWNELYNVLDVLNLPDLEVHKEVPRITRSFLVCLKNRDFHVESREDKNKVFLKSNDYLINSLHFHKLRIDIVELIGDTLNISGSLSSNSYTENMTVELTREFANGKKEVFIGKFVEYPTTNRRIKTFLGIDWQFPYNFDLKIPLTKDEVSNLTFKIVYDDENHHVAMDNHIVFREFAGLSNLGNYLIKNGRIIFFRGRTFYIQPYSYSSVLKLEFKALIRILRAGGPFLLQGIFYRIVYVLLYPFWKNRTIWLFIDRDIIADDNAEHLFKYCIKQDDGIEKYFIINRDSPDYERLNSSLDNVVAFGSFRHKIKYLFSEKIMISQVTRGILNPFTHENSYIYEGLSTYKFCFLQHGVTKDDISWWIKKYHKNLYMFLTVSDLERDSMVNGYYNYEEDRIPVLGFPRYDNLKNDPQKEILFIPTWRRKLDNPEKILNSEFLQSINSFLGNERLIEKANELGYKIVFRPHPELWKFLDFINLENVVLSEGPYQEMFKTASVMITDYSSVAFDFAYLKKPVIYYQDGEYHYGEGYYDYETMGFGKVVEDENALVDKVIEYMENDCKMEDEYAARVDSFFKYTDKNNCKRVYEWLLKH